MTHVSALSATDEKFTFSFWVKISGQANIFENGQRLTGETGDYYGYTGDMFVRETV